MGFLDRLPFLTKANPVGRAIVLSLTGKAIRTPLNYESLAKEGYQKNVYVYACVRTIADAVAGIPWKLSRVSRGTSTPIDEHALLDLVYRPNPEQGGAFFFGSLAAYQLLAGNAYLTHAGPSNGPPQELWTLRPDRMTAIKGDGINGIVSAYKYATGQQKVTLDAEDVLHLKEFHPLDDFYGMSPIEAAAQSIDQNNASKEWNTALLQNSAKPSGAFKYENELSQQQRNFLREQMKDEVHGMGVEGPANAGRVLILEGGADWIPLSMSPRELDFMAGQKQSALEVAIAFNVPPELIGDNSHKTYSNYKEARKAFYMENILPRMDVLRDELNNWLTPMFGDDLWLDYDRDSIEAIQTERSENINNAHKLYTSGMVTLEEARDLAGLPPKVPDGDRVAPANMLPVETRSIERKAFNLTTPEAKADYWKSLDRQRNAWNDKVAKQVSKLFADDLKAIKRRLKNASDPKKLEPAIFMALDARSEDWEEALKAIYIAVGQQFAEQVFDAIDGNSRVEAGAGGPSVTKQEEQMDTWLSSILERLESGSLLKIKTKQIGEATWKAVQPVISDGISEGKSIPQIQDDLEAAWGNMSRVRSERIARTEVIGASNFGSLEAAKATGLPMKKEWLTTDDGRERPEHSAGAGIEDVPIDSPFIVAGEELMYPGDPSGSPGNVINCRCAVAYIPDREAAGLES